MPAFEKPPVCAAPAQALCPFLADRSLSTMNVGESTVLEKVCRPTIGARHITLIDPAKQSAKSLLSEPWWRLSVARQ